MKVFSINNYFQSKINNSSKNFQNTGYLSSYQNNPLSKDSFTPNFKGNSALIDFLDKNRGHRAKVTLNKVIHLITPETINKLGDNGFAPLHIALLRAKDEVVLYMLKQGANPNIEGQQTAPLSYAVGFSRKKLKIVKALLDAGANIHASDRCKYTPLMNAISRGNIPAANLLISKGADIIPVDHEGKSALHHASGWYKDRNINEKKAIERIKLIRKLVAKGCKVDAPDEHGVTPLMQAASGSDLGVVKALLDLGASVKTIDENGLTPLYYACCSDGPAISKINLLLEHGADIEAKDNQGEAILGLVSKYCSSDIKEFLISKGADPSQVVTMFRDLRCSHSSIIDEAKEAGMHGFPFVNAERHHSYWRVDLIPEVGVLPKEKALKLNRECGADVRAFYYAGGLNETKLNEWMQLRNGVNAWDVDTKEGLAALMKALKEHFAEVGQGFRPQKLPNTNYKLIE